MANQGTVNSQITDAVTQSNAGVLGQAPALAADLIYMAAADSIGLAMHNAVTNQQRMQIIAEAVITQTCATIIALGAAEVASGG